MVRLDLEHRGIAGLRAPLIGRDDELRLLVESHRKLAAERRAVLVTLFGNAGVGKSRLVAEFVEAIGPDRVRRGRCLPYGEGITFWPIVEILKDAAGILEAFEPLIDKAVVTENSTTRTMPIAELAEIAESVFGEDRVVVEPNFEDALTRAVDLAEEDGIAGGAGIIVTGSVYTAGQARVLLGTGSRP